MQELRTQQPALMLFSSLDRSLIYTANRNGLKAHPYRTPLETEKEDEI